MCVIARCIPFLYYIATHVTFKKLLHMDCIEYIPGHAGLLKTGLAKKSTHSTTWQFKTIKLLHYLTPGSKLVVYT